MGCALSCVVNLAASGASPVLFILFISMLGKQSAHLLCGLQLGLMRQCVDYTANLARLTCKQSGPEGDVDNLVTRPFLLCGSAHGCTSDGSTPGFFLRGGSVLARTGAAGVSDSKPSHFNTDSLEYKKTLWLTLTACNRPALSAR
jgi:hypothetical protein